MEHQDVTPQSDQVYPILEVVIVDGEPVWQVSGGGITVRAKGGMRALELFWAQCSSKGVEPPQ